MESTNNVVAFGAGIWDGFKEYTKGALYIPKLPTFAISTWMNWKQGNVTDASVVFVATTAITQAMDKFGSNYFVDGLKKGIEKFGSTYLAGQVAEDIMSVLPKIETMTGVALQGSASRAAVTKIAVTDFSIMASNATSYTDMKGLFIGVGSRIGVSKLVETFGGEFGKMAMVNTAIGYVVGQLLDNVMYRKELKADLVKEGFYGAINGGLGSLLDAKEGVLPKKLIMTENDANPKKMLNAVNEASEEVLRRFESYELLAKLLQSLKEKVVGAPNTSAVASDAASTVAAATTNATEAGVKDAASVPTQAEVPVSTIAQASVEPSVPASASADAPKEVAPVVAADATPAPTPAAVDPVLDFSAFKPAETQAPAEEVKASPVATPVMQEQAEPSHVEVEIAGISLVLPKLTVEDVL